MVILALDIATKTGWATENNSGVWNFNIKPGESANLKLFKFSQSLAKLNSEFEFDLIVWERPVGRFKNALIHESKLIGVAALYCYQNSIQHAEYSPAAIKKYATGKGNANKKAMILAAQEKWQNMVIIDDNHADALWLYELAKNDYNLL